MDMSSQQLSSMQGEDNEKFIKKNISPVQRGPSAIFGDPLSQSDEGLMDLTSNSPQSSQQGSRASMMKKRENYQEQEPLNEEQKEQLRGAQQQEHEKRQEGYEQVKNKREENQIIEERPILEDEEAMLSGSPINIEEKGKQPNLISQELLPSSVMHGDSRHENPPPSLTLQRPIINEIYTESQVEKLKLKHTKLHLIQNSPDQSKLILQILQRNMQHLKSIEGRINSQSVILNQFKQQTSRKLEENIKVTIKEKMNQINRENSKELKDIKNLNINLQEMFILLLKRMDTLEKNVEMLLASKKG